MPKVIIDPIKGLYEVAGSGVEINTGITLASNPVSTVSAQTAAGTLTSAGVYTLSGSSALTWTMPLASSVPGGVFVFRTASAHAHILTGSQETAGTTVFSGMPGATPDGKGSRLTMPATQGSSVALISDGASFLVMAASGSMTLAGT